MFGFLEIQSNIDGNLVFIYLFLVYLIWDVMENETAIRAIFFPSLFCYPLWFPEYQSWKFIFYFCLFHGYVEGVVGNGNRIVIGF